MPKLEVELLHLFTAVRRSRQSNGPVWMQMIDVRKRQKAVQGSIDRSCYRVAPERANRIHLNNLLFNIDTAIAIGHPLQLEEVQHRESTPLDTADIAAAALDPQRRLSRAVKRIDTFNLRARVASSKIRDAQIGSQQVRAITQQFGRIQV